MSKRTSETKYEFQCKCCRKKTASYFSKNTWIGEWPGEWPYSKSNDEWDNNGFIYLMCAYCGSIMKMNKSFLEKENYKPSPWHKPSIQHSNILVVKNFFNPPKLRSKKLRGRFR